MNLLALDTSTTMAVLALVRDDGTVIGLTSDPKIRHGRRLVPDIRELLMDAGLSVRDLHALAVGLGPGSFTGLRIGLTAAKVLAYSLQGPLYGLNSLELLARGAPSDALAVVAVADAQRGEVAAVEFHRAHVGGALLRQGPMRVLPRADLFARLDPTTTVVGASAGWTGPIGPAAPTIEALAEQAFEAHRAGGAEDIWFLEPTYARLSAAEEKVEAARQADGHDRKGLPISGA